jgi:hypothetical protein
MRFILPLLLVLTTSAFGQSVDWKTLGRPLDDDTKSMKDRYVYFNSDAMSKNIPVDQALLPQDQVITWVNDHLGQAMTLSGKLYDAQTYNNRLLFTPTGYADYIVYLKNTNLGAFLKTNQYKLAAVVDGVPKINSQGLQKLNNVDTYTWEITSNLALSYLDYRNQAPAALTKDPANKNNRSLVQAQIELIRIPSQNNNIVAINHLSFGAVPTTTESLDPGPAAE